MHFLYRLIWIFLLGTPLFAYGQSIVSQGFLTPDTIPNRARTQLVTAGVWGAYGLGMTGLGTLWYSQEDLSSFHFFDDSHQWQQMDKVGHTYSTYHTTRFAMDLYDWAGQPQDKLIRWGAITGMVMVSSIEVFDGFGESWGFSWPDVAANGAGAGLAILNRKLWAEERLQLKLGYWGRDYSGDSTALRLFGGNLVERLFKDYNGQTMWLSVRVHSFLPEGRFKDHYPRWLNLAIGYGAEGLRGGYDDPLSDWRTREYRQWYLSMDIDLRQIRTRSRFLKTVFSVVSMVRIPLPAVRYDRTGWAFLPLE